jgi:hypothetical protein
MEINRRQFMKDLRKMAIGSAIAANGITHLVDRAVTNLGRETGVKKEPPTQSNIQSSPEFTSQDTKPVEGKGAAEGNQIKLVLHPVNYY